MDRSICEGSPADLQEPRKKRRSLNFVLSNCTWQDGEVVAIFC